MASIEGPADPAEVAARTGGFGDRLAERVAARESQLVLGLDPDPARLWPAALDPQPEALDLQPAALDPQPEALDPEALGPGNEAAGEVTIAERAARAVAAHCALVIAATAEQCVAAKLQVACFERLGAPGWAALAGTVAVARDHGLVVIADAKRGDVDVTAAAYAQAFLGETATPFGTVPGLGADALTVNPLLGRDSLEPLVTAARAGGGGLFVLVRTSNPGAADVQERRLAGGEAVSDRLAELVDEIGSAGIGRSGLSDIGAVVGATAPGRLSALRERMPHTVFLLPGVGAQGGRVEELAPAFAPGPAGGLVSASRGIVAAHERIGGDPAGAAAREASRLRELAWRLTA
ncbi:MAG TPA: orotidine-5'-phosphate decarboxylase [Solirubrobacteraceae bacterium]|nr:orotidine-5'-phosphate decarboxylase [Solirubrobacteraceae bacterium]